MSRYLRVGLVFVLASSLCLAPQTAGAETFLEETISGLQSSRVYVSQAAFGLPPAAGTRARAAQKRLNQSLRSNDYLYVALLPEAAGTEVKDLPKFAKQAALALNDQAIVAVAIGDRLAASSNSVLTENVAGQLTRQAQAQVPRDVDGNLAVQAEALLSALISQVHSYQDRQSVKSGEVIGGLSWAQLVIALLILLVLTGTMSYVLWRRKSHNRPQPPDPPGLMHTRLDTRAPVSDKAELQPTDPKYIGEFKLVRRLGTGGMGQVFLGRDAHGRWAAIKVVHSKLLAEDPRFRLRFEHEVAMLRRIEPGVTAPIIACDTEAALPWLATEYIHAPSLDEWIHDYGPIRDPRQLAWFMMTLAEKISKIHAVGIIHRDLKPSNILLPSNDILVIDFGIARSSDPDATRHTTKGFVGTLAYASPEQLGGGILTTKSDIYMLGRVMLFATTGETSAFEIPTRLGNVGRLMGRCLAPKPDDRPRTVDIISFLKKQS